MHAKESCVPYINAGLCVRCIFKVFFSSFQNHTCISSIMNVNSAKLFLLGNIPEKGDGIVNRTACAPGHSTGCDFKYNIKVENCGTYRMYFLPSPSRCNEAYCFGSASPLQITN